MNYEWDELGEDDDEDNALDWCTACCDNKAVFNGLCDECREEES